MCESMHINVTKTFSHEVSMWINPHNWKYDQTIIKFNYQINYQTEPLSNYIGNNVNVSNYKHIQINMKSMIEISIAKELKPFKKDN
jgi:hypothetical protein